MEVKRCPKCGESLPAEASFCPHCMAQLAVEKALPSLATHRTKRKAPLVALLILGGAAIALSLFLFRPEPATPSAPAAIPSTPVVAPSPEPLAQFHESTAEKPQFENEHIYSTVCPHGTWSIFTYGGKNYLVGFGFSGMRVAMDAKIARRGPNANCQ